MYPGLYLCQDIYRQLHFAIVTLDQLEAAWSQMLGLRYVKLATEATMTGSEKTKDGERARPSLETDPPPTEKPSSLGPGVVPPSLLPTTAKAIETHRAWGWAVAVKPNQGYCPEP